MYARSYLLELEPGQLSGPLGSNINEAGNYFGDSRGSVGWPACGEIDIMEQNGWDKTRSYGYFHWANTQTGEYQTQGTTTFIADSASEFHLYSLIWDETKMQILLDNQVFIELPNEVSNGSTIHITSC